MSEVLELLLNPCMDVSDQFICLVILELPQVCLVLQTDLEHVRVVAIALESRRALQEHVNCSS